MGEGLSVCGRVGVAGVGSGGSIEGKEAAGIIGIIGIFCRRKCSGLLYEENYYELVGSYHLCSVC